MTKKKLIDQNLVPLLPLRNVVVFPKMVLPLFVGREKSIAALNIAMEHDKKIILVTQKNGQNDHPEFDDLYSVGIEATILQLLKLPDGTVKVLIEGGNRVQLNHLTCHENYLAVSAEYLDVSYDQNDPQIRALSRTIIGLFENYAKLSKKNLEDVVSALGELNHCHDVIDVISSHASFRVKEKQRIMNIADVFERQKYVINLLETEIGLMEVEKKVKNRIKNQMEKSQKEYYLTEQIKAIQKELGHDEDANDISELESKISALKLPKEAKEKIESELKKLKKMPIVSAEATVIRHYIDWIIALPWDKKKKLNHDLLHAIKLLDDEHYGLEKVKERIIEYLAVQKRTKKMQGSILCLVGPPGVGKTSLAQSIAKAVNRSFIRIALGGVHDESEIRGHRRTYVGSMPGRIIQKIAKVNYNNPLILLDEIDKLGNDMRGDPASALLEVLDFEQNNSFHDHYLELGYNLSNVMFVCTANSMNISETLLDRMEIIELSSYTEAEKINIALQYLIPKQQKKHQIKNNDLSFSRESIVDLIRFYTKEAGVRGLNQEIERVFRKHIKKIELERLKNKKSKSVLIKKEIIAEDLKFYNGVRKYNYGVAEKKDQIGIVTGLAWTQVGGELLSIETAFTPGKGQIIKTGSLGNVMQESIQIALTVIKNNILVDELDEKFYEKHDIHIHIPEGAIPKDGPSAGIGLCIAMFSMLKKIPVSAKVAMTGEINLRGHILPVGGIKEKLLAAHRAGILRVLIPSENMKDLQNIADDVKKDLDIYPVRHISEVLEIALPTYKKNKKIRIIQKQE